MLGTPARFITARLMIRVAQLSPAYSFRYTPARMPMGAAATRESSTKKNVPTKRRPNAAGGHVILRILQQERGT